MQFTYDHGIATVEQAMEQVIRSCVGDPTTNPLTEEYLTRQIKLIATAGLAEIRMIFTAELSTLFDPEAIAIDWNQAVEKCIQLVEGSL